MKALFNPFRYIAGAKALVFGIIFINTSSLLLHSGGLIQDSYIHIGMATASLWKVIAMQMLWWILPAALLYLCGVLFSKSKIRVIDILGTTAFAQLIMLLMIAPMLLPAVQSCTEQMVTAVMSGATPTTTLPFVIFAVWSTICLLLFYIWNYNAFAVSCNLRGAKAILLFIAVQVVVTIIGVVC